MTPSGLSPWLQVDTMSEALALWSDHEGHAAAAVEDAQLLVYDGAWRAGVDVSAPSLGWQGVDRIVGAGLRDLWLGVFNHDDGRDGILRWDGSRVSELALPNRHLRFPKPAVDGNGDLWLAGTDPGIRLDDNGDVVSDDGPSVHAYHRTGGALQEVAVDARVTDVVDLVAGGDAVYCSTRRGSCVGTVRHSPW